ncbi:hypothetical protein POVWA2_008360 [Plasmodium ovale wallikeri]|uniref:Uncharacterized protein n=1 Tax=Plasmodium ovale wallikeri TaxID=864142 RepID=A0A1A8YL11_PLAOA|nr:hypothetical protein POVWA2_008360 [Plasmodium ovale wallikeri]
MPLSLPPRERYICTKKKKKKENQNILISVFVKCSSTCEHPPLLAISPHPLCTTAEFAHVPVYIFHRFILPNWHTRMTPPLICEIISSHEERLVRNGPS